MLIKFAMISVNAAFVIIYIYTNLFYRITLYLPKIIPTISLFSKPKRL